MSYNVKSIEVFERQAKRLIKKYPSLKKEIFQLIQLLRTNPQEGTPILKGCYKIRLAIASKEKGKSGGARIISNFVEKIQPFICLPFTINLKKKIFLTKSLVSF